MSWPAMAAPNGISETKQVNELSAHVLTTCASALGQGSRVLIGLVGIPGAGKSTLAASLKDAVNKQHGSEVMTVVPMDGFHLTRAQLDEMDDSELAHERRGSEWTFDAVALGALLRRIRVAASGDSSEHVYAPEFDHKEKDPKANSIAIRRHHQIVLVEGLYLFLDKEPWRTHVCRAFDQRWLIECAPDVAKRRVVNRHVTSGVCDSTESAERRWNNNDWPNGQEILSNFPAAEGDAADYFHLRIVSEDKPLSSCSDRLLAT